MIDGNAYDFLDKLYYEDHYVIYNNEKYFFNGCQSRISPDGKVMSVRLEIYNLSTDKTVFSVTKASASECIEALEDALIWNGKSFWDIEKFMKWVDD